MSNSSGDISIKIQAIASGIDDATKQLRDLEAGLKAEGAAGDAVKASLGPLTGVHRDAGNAASEHAGKMTNLHEILGSSRHESLMLEQQLVGLAGASKAAGGAAALLGQGFEAAMTGIGPLGIAVSAVSIGIGLLSQHFADEKKSLDDASAALLKYAEQQNKVGIALAGYNTNLVSAAQAEEKHKEAIKAKADKVVELEKQLKDLVGIQGDELTVVNDMIVTTRTASDRESEIAKLTDEHRAAVGALNDALHGLTPALIEDHIQEENFGAVVDFTTGKINAQTSALYALEAAQHAAYRESLLTSNEDRPFVPHSQRTKSVDDILAEERADAFKLSQWGTGHGGGGGGSVGHHIATGMNAATTATQSTTAAVQQLGGAINQLFSGAPGSRDLAKELAMEFSGESAAIQAEFVQALGGNKDLAIKQWMEQHRRELMAEFAFNPAQFGAPGAPGTIGGTPPTGAASALGGPLKDGATAELAKLKPSDSLITAINSDVAAITTAGHIIGKYLQTGIVGELSDSDFINKLARALVGPLGNYFAPASLVK